MHNSLSVSKKSSEQKGVSVQFTGAMPGGKLFSMKPQYKELCSRDGFDKILDMLEPSYKEYFEEFLANFRVDLRKKPHLFKDMPDELRAGVQNNRVIVVLPKKGFMGRMVDAVTAPFTYCVESVKNKFASKEKLVEIKKLNQVKTTLSNIEGLVEYVENLKEKDPAQVKKIIQDKIKKNFTKIKASYSSNLATTLTDLSTFVVAAVYHGWDFYNLTRRVDDNHERAMKEAKVKVKQDAIRLVVMSYLTYVVTTMFKKDCNRSMPRMFAVASLIQLSAEIINRKITGRPIIPLNSKTLKAYKDKQNKKQNVSNLANENLPKPVGVFKFNNTSKIFNQFGSADCGNKKISFTGSPLKVLFSKEFTFPKNELANILSITRKIDSEQAKRFEQLIEINLSGELKGKKLETLCADDKITNLSLGKKESVFEKVLKCVFIPVTALVKLAKRVSAKGKEQVDEFVEVKKHLLFVNKLLKSKYKGKDVLNNKADFNEFRKDMMNASLSSFRTTEANYNTANYSIIKRIFSYSIFTTFIAADAYNVTMMHSDGDKKKSLIQAKQRIIQEMTRFFISIYTASASLTMFGALYNKTLGNAFGLTALTSTTNNALTRTTLGLPILPKSKEQLLKLDEKNNKSSFHRFINKLTGKSTEKH